MKPPSQKQIAAAALIAILGDYPQGLIRWQAMVLAKNLAEGRVTELELYEALVGLVAQGKARCETRPLGAGGVATWIYLTQSPADPSAD